MNRYLDILIGIFPAYRQRNIDSFAHPLNITNGPAYDNTYNKISATSEDSDQPAHPRRLIRIFADPMCFLQPPDYRKRDKREPLAYRVDVQADQRFS